jgi:N6-adenosine-specific RNA methylase IME4
VKFRVILADPPWFHADRRSNRKDNPAKKSKFGIGAQGNYSRRGGGGVMTIEELEAMGPLVQSVAAEDAFLFLWVTCPLMLFQSPGNPVPWATRVMQSWGFRYKTVAFVWTKTCLDEERSKPGPGYYTPSNVELCLLGVRQHPGPRGGWEVAKPWNPTHGWKPSQEIRCPHPRGPIPVWDDLGNQVGEKTGILHSRKPHDAHERLERWLGPVIGDHRFLELFATEQLPRWTCLGDEVTGNKIGQDLRDLREAIDYSHLLETRIFE